MSILLQASKLYWKPVFIFLPLQFSYLILFLFFHPRIFSENNRKAIDETWYKRAVDQHTIEPESFVFSVPFNARKWSSNSHFYFWISLQVFLKKLVFFKKKCSSNSNFYAVLVQKWKMCHQFLNDNNIQFFTHI